MLQANDIDKKQLTAIRHSAMNILAGREHSIFELEQKLKKKYIQQDGGTQSDALIRSLIARVMKQLIADKLVDDERFTECFIRSRINKGSGPVKIRYELSKRGISREISNEYMDDSYAFWRQYIHAVREKRFGVQYPKNYKQQAKQSRFLYQRGFSGEFIRRLFNQ